MSQILGTSNKINIFKIFVEIGVGICLLAIGYYLGKKNKQKVDKTKRGIELEDKIIE